MNKIVYVTEELLPVSPNWETTKWQEELDKAIEQGCKYIVDGENFIYKIFNGGKVQDISEFNFGDAIQFMKEGFCVARKGWNGKNMFIYLNKGSRENFEATDDYLIDGVSVKLFNKGDTGTVTRMPNLNMRAASGNIVTGWLSSQTDILAEDWTIILSK